MLLLYLKKEGAWLIGAENYTSWNKHLILGAKCMFWFLKYWDIATYFCMEANISETKLKLENKTDKHY